MASTQTEPPPPLPSGKNRARSLVFIALFVGLQFVVPLTYLLRDDVSDDRFTWRSLTPPRAPACETTASLQHRNGERELIDLEASLHDDWVDYVKLGRKSVVKAFLDQSCAREGAVRVELLTRCFDDHVETVFERECASGQAAPRTAAR